MLEQEFSLGQIKEILVEPPSARSRVGSGVLLDALDNRGLFAYKGVLESAPAIKTLSLKPDIWSPRNYKERLGAYRSGLEVLGFTSVTELLATGYMENMSKFESLFKLDPQAAQAFVAEASNYSLPARFRDFLRLYINGSLQGVNEQWLGQKGFAEKFGISQSWTSKAINANYPVRLSFVAQLVEQMGIPTSLKGEIIDKYSEDAGVSLSGSAAYLNSETKTALRRPLSSWLDEVGLMTREKLSKIGFNNAEEFLFTRYINSSEVVVSALDKVEELSKEAESAKSLTPIFEAMNIKSLADLDKVNSGAFMLYLDAWIKRGLLKSSRTTLNSDSVASDAGAQIGSQVSNQELTNTKKASKRAYKPRKQAPEMTSRRENVFNLVQQGLSDKEIATQIGVSKGVVSQDIYLLRLSGKEINRPKKNYRVIINEGNDELPTYDAFLKVLQQELESNSSQLPNFSRIAEALGKSRQRIGQLWDRCMQSNDPQIKGIVEEVNKRGNQVINSRETRIYTREQRVAENKRRRENLENQVLDLRKEGLSVGQIERMLGLKRGRAMYVLQKKFGEDPSLRTRKIYRSRQEMELFRSQVKELREQGLTHSEIKDRLDVKLTEVIGALKDLLDAGLVERKVPGRHVTKVDRAEISSRREQVLNLRKAGLEPRVIASQLGIPVTTIRADIRVLQEASKLPKMNV